jgi:hypothetical protein
VYTEPGRHPVPIQYARCAESHLGCSCRGDESVHEARAKEVDEARAHAADTVDCPECGEPTQPLRLLAWGHCRACHTAQSRTIHPLRW